MDNYNDISPKYMMELIPKIEERIWNLFTTSKYKNVFYYINRFHSESGGSFNNEYWENFTIFYKNESNETDKVIDLVKTLNLMPNEVLLRIANDLGIDIPGLLPIVYKFKIILEEKNKHAFNYFERALKNAVEHPEDSIALANSTLESILKTILKEHMKDGDAYNEKDTLYDLAQKVLTYLKLHPSKNFDIKEISAIGNGLLKVCQNIESLRSTKTSSHGKLEKDYVISNPLWSFFILNSISTIGVLLSDYSKNITNENKTNEDLGEINIDKIPF